MSVIVKDDVTKRILQSMKAKDLTYERLTDLVNEQNPERSIKYYQLYEAISKGRYNSAFFPFIARALDEEMEYLVWGKRNRVPIINWSDVENWPSSDKHLPIIAKSPKTRALKLLDDSMKTIFIETPTFAYGSYVIAEPAKEVQLDSYVIAILEDGSPIFRWLTLDKKKQHRILKPLNPYFPEHLMSDEIIIKTVVISSYTEI